ncbi:hypothetical protein M0R45_020100 [Rubus argutus]|uniref:Uncharacterized protein n=1 Tax=Rubus argutus TaxID=59490 RepID=A0AAW1X9Q8_RUBAR
MSGEEDSFGTDFLGLLLKAHHDANQNQRISVDDLVDDCKTIYFALHKDWQEEARKEVLQLFGKQNPNPDGISKLKTMSMNINESLRLYPPVAAFPRRAEREVRLGNLIVPANLELVISVLVLHHEPQFCGPDVHFFKPERFSNGVAKATNNNVGAFLPFGLGTRTCVGLNFATTEAKIALSIYDSSTLLLHFFPGLYPLTLSVYYTSPTAWSPSVALTIVNCGVIQTR